VTVLLGDGSRNEMSIFTQAYAGALAEQGLKPILKPAVKQSLVSLPELKKPAVI